MATPDYTREAEALFARFAERHGLIYEVETDVPMDVCWTFPRQPKLALPVTLGLQNGDELNFSVSDFQSSFFPFDKVAAEFESVLDAWVQGEARIEVAGRRKHLLQVRRADGWKSMYSAKGCLFPFKSRPRGFIENRSAEST